MWFDNNGYHSMAIWTNILNNAVLRAGLPADADPKKHGIVAINHPLNLTQSDVSTAALYDHIYSFTVDYVELLSYFHNFTGPIVL